MAYTKNTRWSIRSCKLTPCKLLAVLAVSMLTVRPGWLKLPMPWSSTFNTTVEPVPLPASALLLARP